MHTIADRRSQAAKQIKVNKAKAHAKNHAMVRAKHKAALEAQKTEPKSADERSKK